MICSSHIGRNQGFVSATRSFRQPVSFNRADFYPAGKKVFTNSLRPPPIPNR
jgi:hypothetical protein